MSFPLPNHQLGSGDDLSHPLFWLLQCGQVSCGFQNSSNPVTLHPSSFSLAVMAIANLRFWLCLVWCGSVQQLPWSPGGLRRAVHPWQFPQCLLAQGRSWTLLPPLHSFPPSTLIGLHWTFTFGLSLLEASPTKPSSWEVVPCFQHLTHRFQESLCKTPGV